MSTLKTSSRHTAGPSSALSRRRPDSWLRTPQNLAKCECELVGGLGRAGSSCSAALRSGQNCLILGQAGAATAREEEAISHVPAICCTERCLDNQILKTFVIKSTMSSIIIPLFSKIIQTITTHHITIFRRSRSHATVCHSKIVTVCHVLIPSGRVGARSPD